MTTDYEPIAELYKRSKRQPWRAHIEAYSLLGLVGELVGRSVLDVACGEGFYTRLLRRSGAARVTGVDLSPSMIALARLQETAQPLGIDYIVGDGKDLSFDDTFDLIFAAYFLNYAHDPLELQAMCASLSRCLKPGGRFLTVNSSPLADFNPTRSYRKYGFETQGSGPLHGGAPITWKFFLEEGESFVIENYFLDQRTHEAAFRAAGFSQVSWPTLRLSPEGEAEFGRSFWTDFLDYPPIALIECVK